MKKKEKKQMRSLVEEDAPLSQEEVEMLRSSVEQAEVDRSKLPPHDTSEKANVLRFWKKNPLLAITLILVILLLIASFGILFYVISDMNSKKPCTDDFTITIGEESYKAKYETAMVNGVFYIDMRKIADYAGLTVSGSATKIKFTGDNGTYMQFENGLGFAKVNGIYVSLDGTATVNADECFIPFDFLSRALVSGIYVKLDSSTNNVKVLRKYFDAEYTQPSTIIFSSDAFTPITDATVKFNESNMNYNYPIDTSPYLQYMNTERLDLVNKRQENTLSAEYVPDDLVILNDLDIKLAVNKTFRLQKEAAYSLEAMMRAMVASDPSTSNAYVTSAYRDYNYQVSTFEYYVKKHMTMEGLTREAAEAKVETYSARPGTSEHQTGLCVDIMTTQMTDLDESFENTTAFAWLSRNAHLYGFIIRFPENKENITGYKYEPWHYRFVGIEAAVEIYNSGLCLEEYLKKV